MPLLPAPSKLFPGTLWIFLLGSLIYRHLHEHAALPGRLVRGAAVLVVVHLAWMATRRIHIDVPYAFESLSGVLLGMGSLLMFARSTPGNRRLDDWLGQLSYPLFLSHVCVLYFFDHLRMTQVFDPGVRGAAALQTLAAVGLSVPLALLDERLQRLRKRFQRRPAGAAAIPAEAAPLRKSA